MFLVGDIGNTETKICLLNNRYKKIKKITLNTQKLSIKYLTQKTLLIKKNIVQRGTHICPKCQILKN